MAIRFTDLYHLLLDVARYEMVRALITSAKTNSLKGTYYYEVAEILAKQTNKASSNSSDEEEQG